MASYNIVFKTSVAARLHAFPNSDVKRILERIDQLAENPRPKDAKQLVGDEKYRVQYGRYRILYAIQNNQIIIATLKAGRHTS